MCNFSKFYSHFGGQSIHLNFSKALQEKHWNWSFLSSTGKLVTWKDPQKWGWDQNWNRSHFDLNSHLHCKVLGVSRDICLRLETELFEKVSVRSIKQKEGALYFGHVQGENYTSALWLLLPEKTASGKHLDFLCWKENITTLPWSQLWWYKTIYIETTCLHSVDIFSSMHTKGFTPPSHFCILPLLMTCRNSKKRPHKSFCIKCKTLREGAAVWCNLN